MPKRWEQELRRLGDVPAPTERIQARSTRPSEPRQGDGMPPTRQRVLAGVVAFGVFIAAGAFLVRAIDPTRPDRAPGNASPLPTLRMTFESGGPIGDGAGDMVRVDTVLDYGDLHEESFTSTLPPGGIVDYVSVERVTPMFPAPTTGSVVSIEADGDDPRVLIGEPEAWPEFDRFERIDRLPAEPGRYVLIFEADYPEGVASTARLVDLAAPGAVQVAVTEGGNLDAATASLAIDGNAHDGFLTTSSYTVSDFGRQSQPRDPSFSDDDYIEVERRAPIVVGGGPDTLVKSLSREGDDIRLPRWRGDMLNVDTGRYLLTLTATWKHGKIGWANDGTLEEATFKFPIEIVSVDDPDATSTQIPDRSTGEPSDVLRIRCEEGRTTILTPVVAAGPDGVEVEVLPLGGEHPIEFREEDPSSSFGGSIPADGRSHPWPIAPGNAEVACNVSLEGSVPFEVVDPAGHYGGAELDCDADAQAEVVGYDGGAVLWIDEAGAIRGILRGVRETDRVVPSQYGRDRLARWSIVRDDSVVGLVTFTSVTAASDPKGSGLGRVDGTVCAASGIDGTVRPRDPDGDGIDLDCRAGSQVTFRHRGLYNLPLGESYVRVNVMGLRPTDELVPPTNGTGPGGYEGTWTVVREVKTVASIEYPSLDGITCRWNAIGIDLNEL